jgi:hypothetical protein
MAEPPLMECSYESSASGISFSLFRCEWVAMLPGRPGYPRMNTDIQVETQDCLGMI